jgi:hypothetical protein
MPPLEFSRRHRRWVHHPKKVMRCFTDEEIRRGITAVLADKGRFAADERELEIFLNAAHPAGEVDQPPGVKALEDLARQTPQTWPFPHPMHCPSCDRAITDATGRSLVKIVIEDSIWKCATCP